MKLIPAPMVAHLVLAAMDQRILRAMLDQQILGEVQLGIREEAGIEHDVAVNQFAGILGPAHAAEIPKRGPEGAALIDRPLMEGLLSAKRLLPWV